MLNRRASASFDWAFYFFWLVASTLGWVLGSFFPPGIAFIASGLAIGVLQWLPLKSRLNHPWRWMPATAAAWTISWFLFLPLNPGQSAFLTGLILGLVSGIAQWWVLRDEIDLAGWWIVISVVGWTTGLALMPGFFTSGMVPGAVTGLAMELLLRFTKEK